MNLWPRTSEPEETKIGWRRIVRKTFVDPDGHEQEYYTNYSVGDVSIAVIGLTPENNIIVAEQFRPGPEKILEELPGGAAEPGEDAQTAAEREFHEETGYRAGEIKLIGSVYKDAYSNTTSKYFLATNCVKDSEPHTDDGEYITVKEITISKLFENAHSLMMTDVEAVFLAYEELKAIEKGSNR